MFTTFTLPTPQSVTYRYSCIARRWWLHHDGKEATQELLLALAPSLVNNLKAQSDAHIIRGGVERRDFLYGKNAKIQRVSFEDDYFIELPTWFESVLKRPLQYATPLLTEADMGLVFGGGAMLPGIEALLKKCGYTVVDDPVNANVRGLYEVAKAMVSKGGHRG